MEKRSRPILDCGAGNPSVHSEFTKSCDQFWGEIHHPTISDFVIMIMEFWEVVSSLDSSLSWWDDLILWKIDLKGAYTLLSFEDAAIPYVAAELDSDAIIFFLCGVFGWAGILLLSKWCLVRSRLRLISLFMVVLIFMWMIYWVCRFEDTWSQTSLLPSLYLLSSFQPSLQLTSHRET
jgi:hypothetical protein